MNIGPIEQSLGYRFKEPKHLERALTHRSWAHENRGRGETDHIPEDNEALEFVGDSVLGLAIAELLFRKYPELSEGSLTLMKHKLVSSPTLARISGELNLSDFVKMGRGEAKTGGREKSNIAADTLEAVIAAIFLDGGFVEARAFVARIFAPEIKGLTPGGSTDAKSNLQELLQANKLAAPTYNLLRTEGPPHDRTFYVEAIWVDGRAEGSGRSLKLAEMAAAISALEMLESNDVRG